MSIPGWMTKNPILSQCQSMLHPASILPIAQSMSLEKRIHINKGDTMSIGLLLRLCINSCDKVVDLFTITADSVGCPGDIGTVFGAG